MGFRLPDLPYSYDALEPYVSAETLKLHHDKHHKSYVEKLNSLLKDSGLAELELEEIIQKSADNPDLAPLFNNAAQSWNHSFFWHCMAADGGGAPEGELARQLKEDFGSLEDFQNAFLEAATSHFGSGWVWLVLDSGNLRVVATENATPPMVMGQQTLLTCDLWEHAYYLDYQNRKGEFFKNFMNELVNWKFVEAQFANQGEGASSSGRRFQAMQRDFAESGDVEGAAKDAKRALEGSQGEELEKARRRSAGN